MCTTIRCDHGSCQGNCFDQRQPKGFGESLGEECSCLGQGSLGLWTNPCQSVEFSRLRLWASRRS